MKIEGNGQNLPVQNDAIERAEADRRAQPSDVASTPGGPAGDRLKLSPDAEIARDAIRQAAALPEVRQELVDRVRKLLDQGEVGGDPEKLADAIIDSLIDHSVDG